MILQIIITIIFLTFIFLILLNFKKRMRLQYLLYKKELAYICVTYVDQKYKELKKGERYVLARDIIIDMFSLYDLKTSDSEVDILIESIMYKLNDPYNRF